MDYTLQELEQYFASVTLPETIQLSTGNKITNVSKFIDGHLSVLKHNGENNKGFIAFKQRLQLLRQILENPKTDVV